MLDVELVAPTSTLLFILLIAKNGSAICVIESMNVSFFLISLTYYFTSLIIHFYFSVPEEFQYDPVSKSYGDPSRRPEVKSATIEFIAPSEYMACIIGIIIDINTFMQEFF